MYVEDKVINLSCKVQKYQICNYDIEGFADITGGKEIWGGNCVCSGVGRI
jgi:hypothetical protein